MDRHFRITAVSFAPGQFATVFQNITASKRAEAEIQHQLATTDALLEAATGIATLDLDTLLGRLVAIVAERLGRSRVVIHLFESAREIRTVAATDLRVLRTGEIQRLDDYSPELQHATLARKPVVVDFTVEGLSEPAARERQRLQAEIVLYVPLLVQERLIGIATIDEPLTHLPFSDRDVGIASALAAQAAVAIENARLFAEQAHIATTLQQNFIHPLPEVAGLDIASSSATASDIELVGGDFSDVFVLADGRTLILIGDVAGKGIRAAGLTEAVRSTVRAFATVDAAPAFILRNTNELLLQQSDADAPHVTALVCVLDPSSGRVSLGSAGHPPPVHLSPFSCDLWNPPFGPPLGAFSADYQTSHRTLAPDDCLVLYTTASPRRVVAATCSARRASSSW